MGWCDIHEKEAELYEARNIQIRGRFFDIIYSSCGCVYGSGGMPLRIDGELMHTSDVTSWGLIGGPEKEHKTA